MLVKINIKVTTKHETMIAKLINNSYDEASTELNSSAAAASDSYGIYLLINGFQPANVSE